MFQHLSRLFRHSAVYGLAETVSRGTGFILLFIYIRLMTDDQLGVRRALYASSAIITLFYTLGLDQAFLRYYMDKDLVHRKSDTFVTAIAFTLTCGLLLPIPSLLWGTTLSNMFTASDAWVYPTQLLFLIMLCDSLALYPMQVLRAQNRFIYYLFISSERFILFIVLNVLFVGVLRRGVQGIFEANLIVVTVVIVSLLPVYAAHRCGRISLPLLRRMLAFGIPTILGLVAMRVIDVSDTRLILHFINDETLGLYSVVYTLGMVGITVFVNSFRIAWQPFFLSLKTDPEAERIFSGVATYYSLFISTAFLGMTVFRDEILRFYAPDKPLAIAPIIPLVAMSYILYGFYIIMLPGTFFREKTGVLTFAACSGAIVNVLLNLFLIPRFSLAGAAWATLFAYIVMVSILFTLSQRSYRIIYDVRRLCIIWGVTAIPATISFILHPESRLLQFSIGVMLFIIPSVCYFSTGFFSPAERKYALSLIRRK